MPTHLRLDALVLEVHLHRGPHLPRRWTGPPAEPGLTGRVLILDTRRLATRIHWWGKVLPPFRRRLGVSVW